MRECSYCGCDADAHEPVTVEHGGGTDRFCNFGCLRAHIDEAGLAEGTSCNWAPGADQPT
jgi:hypothetical protein